MNLNPVKPWYVDLNVSIQEDYTKNIGKPSFLTKKRIKIIYSIQKSSS